MKCSNNDTGQTTTEFTRPNAPAHHMQALLCHFYPSRAACRRNHFLTPVVTSCAGPASVSHAYLKVHISPNNSPLCARVGWIQRPFSVCLDIGCDLIQQRLHGFRGQQRYLVYFMACPADWKKGTYLRPRAEMSQAMEATRLVCSPQNSVT